MPKYEYVAQSPDDALEKGVQKAATAAEARIAVEERGLRVTEISVKRVSRLGQLLEPRVKRDELMNLSRQLGALIRAGIPILEAIAELGYEESSRSVKRTMTQIGDDLRDGYTLAEAFDRHPRDFPPFYLGILHSAELTGELDTVLDRLSGYIERDLEIRRKLKAAMIYPAVIAVMSLVTIVVLSGFVLPKFKVFFAGLGAQLPLPTRMLLATTDFLVNWWWLIACIMVLLVSIYALGIRTRRGRRLRDRMLLRVPLLGETIRFAVIERFTRLLGSMLSSGITLPVAMQVATASLHNLVFEDALTDARAQLVEGAGLAGPIAKTGLFPSMASRMIRVGESTGTLDTQLEVTGLYYERELDYKIKKLTTVFEPLVIVLMGGIVGFVAVALVSAMYGIFRSVNLS